MSHTLLASVVLVLGLAISALHGWHRIQALALHQRYLILADPAVGGVHACQHLGPCQSDLAWRENGQWRDLCPRPPPPQARGWRPVRYYRLQWRCRIGSWRTGKNSFVLLSWTLLR